MTLGIEAAARCQWNDVWDSFDKCQSANKGRPANENAGETSRDMFAGIAAE